MKLSSAISLLSFAFIILLSGCAKKPTGVVGYWKVDRGLVIGDYIRIYEEGGEVYGDQTRERMRKEGFAMKNLKLNVITLTTYDGEWTLYDMSTGELSDLYEIKVTLSDEFKKMSFDFGDGRVVTFNRIHEFEFPKE